MSDIFTYFRIKLANVSIYNFSVIRISEEEGWVELESYNFEAEFSSMVRYKNYSRKEIQKRYLSSCNIPFSSLAYDNQVAPYVLRVKINEIRDVSLADFDHGSIFSLETYTQIINLLPNYEVAKDREDFFRLCLTWD